MTPVEAIAWASSVILVVTLAKQVYKQWHAGSSQGVSIFLFLGQFAASSGFSVYSVLVHNWVFVVTNALMMANAPVGFWITARQKSRM